MASDLTFITNVILHLEEGALPKQTAKETLKALNKLHKDLANSLKVVGILQTTIPARLLKEHFVEQTGARTGVREVILSEYLCGK